MYKDTSFREIVIVDGIIALKVPELSSESCEDCIFSEYNNNNNDERCEMAEEVADCHYPKTDKIRSEIVYAIYKKLIRRKKNV